MITNIYLRTFIFSCNVLQIRVTIREKCGTQLIPDNKDAKHEAIIMETSQEIGSGDVVSGLEPDELVKIQRIAPFGSKKLLEGVGT